MTKRKLVHADDGFTVPRKTSTVEVRHSSDEKPGRTLARITLDPQTRHAELAMSFGSNFFGDSFKPDIAECSAALSEDIQRSMDGNLSLADRVFTSQAISLDVLFTELVRRSGANMGQYPQTAERYMRLALKAQSNCRATLEALAKLHQPREQTVRHVHVSEGGQAIIADEFHQHRGSEENAKPVKQSLATARTVESPALPRPNAQGNGVPSPSREGQKAVPNARGQQSGRA